MHRVLLGFLDYDAIVRIHLGPLSISPHGIGIAVGFLAGLSLIRPAARARGISDDQLYALAMRAAVGAIVGARVAFVVNHLGSFDSPLEWFALPFWSTMDAIVPGMALGIALGRFGDLIVGDHLGKRTDFFLGYVCRGTETASPCNAPIGQAVHQPALYDIFTATTLLVVLLWLRRTPRYAGFLTLVFGAWYGAGRIVEDFFRVDVTHGTGLTGSQWTALVVVLICLYRLVILRHPPGSPREMSAESSADERDTDLEAPRVGQPPAPDDDAA